MQLHPEHGLNPTVCVCLFCGRDTGELALLGNAYKGEAPHKMAMNDAPCAKCREEWAQGIAFMENDGQHNTGRVIVLKDEAVEKLGMEPAMYAQIMKARMCKVEVAMFKQMIGEE